MRLKVTFHRTFTLVRAALSQMLEIAQKYLDQPVSRRRVLSFDTIREGTNLGTIYVQSMRRYACGTNLMDSNDRLTPLGTLVTQRDIGLSHLNTQWLMHYHLSAPLGPGPAFWHHLITTCFRPGEELTVKTLTERIQVFVQEQQGEPLVPRSAQTTARIFVGTYTKPDGLKSLGLLEEIDANRYRVGEPAAPPWQVLGYALLDYWDQCYPGLRTINLDDLSKEGRFCSLFLMGAGRLNIALRSLQEAGYLQVYRVAPPYQVVRLRDDKQRLLESLYGHKNEQEFE